MIQPTELFPQNSESSLLETPEKIPLAKSTRWHYKHYSCAAYQLPNGELVMSDRQASRPVKQSKRDVKEFMESHNLESILVQIPNRKVISTYSLSTVAIYWRYLLDSRLISEQLADQYEWKDIIESSQHPGEVTLLSTAQEEQEPEFIVTPANSIVLELQRKLLLEVLILPKREYRISPESGLGVIGVLENWLQELPNSPRKLKTLLQRGFSGESKLCQVNTTKESKIVESLSLNDWLTIWEVFAFRGNSKAAAVLKACAKQNIPLRVEAALKPYSIQERFLYSKTLA